LEDSFDIRQRPDHPDILLVHPQLADLASVWHWTVGRPDDAEFASLRTHFGNLHPGVRPAIVIDVERIADACGYAVPYCDLVDERPVLDAHHAKAPDEAYIRLVKRNRHSIDGLPALNADHPLPSSSSAE
jgi:hypothetical protein